MPRLDWRVVVKALAGFAAGLALWAFVSPTYDAIVARGAQWTIRFFEKPSVTRLRVADDGYTTVDRSDFDPRSKRPAIPIHDLTFNFILLTALFAASKHVFSDRNIRGFLIAILHLYLTHVLGTITEVMSIYSTKLGLWSDVKYDSFEQQLWTVSNHFYRLVLMYAIAFSLWWIFGDRTADGGRRTAEEKPAKKRKRR